MLMLAQSQTGTRVQRIDPARWRFFNRRSSRIVGLVPLKEEFQPNMKIRSSCPHSRVVRESADMFLELLSKTLQHSNGRKKYIVWPHNPSQNPYDAKSI